MPAHATIQRNIVVAGDIMVDHYLYEGSRLRPTGRRDHAMLPVRKLGGAAGVKSLLDKLIGSRPTSGPWCIADGWNVHLGTTEPNIDAATSDHHAFAIWRSFNKERGNDKAQVWRADPRMWYSHTYASFLQDSTGGDPSKQPYIPRATAHPVEANILVLDDAGIAFRQAERATWLLPHPQAPTRWILLKLSGPMAESELWTLLTGSFADKLVCIVSADDLRSEFVELSRGLSWERTVEDLRRELLHNKTIKSLMDCRHLIVTFSIDGALWIDQTDREQVKATLFFDAGHAEGEHDAELGRKVDWLHDDDGGLGRLCPGAARIRGRQRKRKA